MEQLRQPDAAEKPHQIDFFQIQWTARRNVYMTKMGSMKTHEKYCPVRNSTLNLESNRVFGRVSPNCMAPRPSHRGYEVFIRAAVTHTWDQATGAILYVMCRGGVTVPLLLPLGDQTRGFQAPIRPVPRTVSICIWTLQKRTTENRDFSKLSICRKRCTFQENSTTRCDANPQRVTIIQQFIRIKTTTLNF
jgi:hypothetical protein